MIGYEEEDFLVLSRTQYFAFYRCQWALIHTEQLWEENLRTVEDDLPHANCHDSYSSESRKEVFLSRGMPVFSRSLGVSGECDIVEFRQSTNRIPLYDRAGVYTVYPVEYEYGEPKGGDIGILQLVAQATCLEEILSRETPAGVTFYGRTKHRQRVEITEECKERAWAMFAEMHGYFQRGYMPKGRLIRNCSTCSLKGPCLPKLYRIRSVQKHLGGTLGTGEAGQ